MYMRPARRRMRTRTTVIIIAAIAAAVVIILLLISGAFSALTVSSSELVTIESPLPDNVTANSNGILYNKNDTLHLMDMNGKELWNLTLEIPDASFVASEDLICNYSGKTLNVMTYTKEQLVPAATVDSDIQQAAAGKACVAVLVNSKSETGVELSYIYLFSAAGEQLKQIDFSTKQVIDFGFHGESDMLWVLQLDTSGVVPVSYINTYKSDGSSTGSMPINSQIVEQVYITNSIVYASGTYSLMSYAYVSGEKQNEELVYGWYPTAHYVTDQAIKLAYIPRTKTPDIETVRVYAGDLSNIHIRLPKHIISLAVTGEKLYAFADESVYIYSADGALEKESQLGITVAKTKQVSNNCVILWDGQKSYIMQL